MKQIEATRDSMLSKGITSLTSIEEYLSKNFISNWEESSVHQHYYNYLQWVYEEFEGIEFKDQALTVYGTDEHFEGGNLCVKGGLIGLVEFLASGLDIRLQHKVMNIEGYDKNGEEASVITDQGVFTAKKVVIAVPLGVLKSNQITFKPELPAFKSKSINCLSMGLMNKIFLIFDKPFWDPNVKRIHYVSSIKGEFPWIDTVSIGEPVLQLWLACSYAEKIELLTDEEIILKALDVVKIVFQKKELPPLKKHIITRWGQEPFSLGSWSVRPVGSSSEDNKSLAKAVENIHFCGEATHEMHPGTVHGALLSGKRAGREVLSELKK